MIPSMIVVYILHYLIFILDIDLRILDEKLWMFKIHLRHSNRFLLNLILG